MSKRYKEIVFKGLTIQAPKGKRLIISKNEYGKAEMQIVTKKKNSDVFFRITASKREKVRKWLAEHKLKEKRTPGEIYFLDVLSDALEEINYNYEIATMEPTVVDGKIAYIKGKDVAVNYSIKDWIKMAEEYLPERGSRLATLYELFIWYAWRIVKGYWTLGYVANDSSSAGNFCNSPKATHKLELTGTIKCGGFRDGQGNSCKLVTYKNIFATVGGNFDNNGYNSTVHNVFLHYSLDDIINFDCGVLVLIK